MQGEEKITENIEQEQEPEKPLNRENKDVQDEENGTEYVEKELELKKQLNRGLQGKENSTDNFKEELELQKHLNRGKRGLQGRREQDRQHQARAGAECTFEHCAVRHNMSAFHSKLTSPE